jgi:hypothetical protein
MPNERGNQPNWLSRTGQRLGNSARNFYNRQAQGARNATPGHQGWGWQLADMLTEPFVQGNLYNSQAAPGERRFQVPGEGLVRGIGGMFGGRENPGYTPGAGMGIMPNLQGWQPSGGLLGEGSINIQPNIPGTLPQGQGPLRSYGNPPPRNTGNEARQSMNAANQAQRHAEELEMMWRMFGGGMPRGER